MNPALGPFAIAAILLVVGGALKAVRPHDTAYALRAMALPGSERVVRAGGVAEVALGVAALVTVDPVVAILIAVSYAAFAAFVALALARRLPITSCGCLGRVDTPPTVVHIGVCLGACVAAVGMAIDTAISPLDVVTGDALESAAYVALVAIGALTAYALLAVLPRAQSVDVLGGGEGSWR